MPNRAGRTVTTGHADIAMDMHDLILGVAQARCRSLTLLRVTQANIVPCNNKRTWFLDEHRGCIVGVC